jgi:hypothetical protein
MIEGSEGGKSCRIWSRDGWVEVVVAVHPKHIVYIISSSAVFMDGITTFTIMLDMS